MRQNIKIILAAAPLLFLALFAATLSFLHAGLPEVTVRISGYDPRDLLSGHYIAYTIDWDNTDCTQFENNICPKGDFYETGIYGLQGNNHRFYVPEDKADKLDALLENRGGEHIFEIVYGYDPGFRPLAKKLLIDGQDWRLFTEQPESK